MPLRPFTQEVLYGTILSKNLPPDSSGKGVVIHNKSRTKSFCLGEEILSKHILLIGSTGTGKTNLFYHIVKQLKASMTADDVMLIFDSKGDFYSKFFNFSSHSDVVIGNSPKYKNISEKWNIYNEITADGIDEISQNIREICKSLFAKRLENSATNPFFPNAASDVLMGIMTILIRGGIKFTNLYLKNFIDNINVKELADNFLKYKDLQTMNTYIDSRGGAQSLGVLAEMYEVTRDVLTGVFAKSGNFSMRNFIRNKGGRTAFLEYDLAIGDVLAPVYTLLFDLALKEALGRTKTNGNVYFVADELKLLPDLRHLDDGINFGRGLGVKILAGLQSIEQLNANYDNEAKAKNAIAGFSSVVAFRSGDFNTREYISKTFGKNLIVESFEQADRTRKYENREGFVVEDWDILNLKTGEAVVKLPENPPFKFDFLEYK